MICNLGEAQFGVGVVSIRIETINTTNRVFSKRLKIILSVKMIKFVMRVLKEDEDSLNGNYHLDGNSYGSLKLNCQ